MPIENAENEKEENDILTSSTEQRPLFSQDEIEATVKGFLLAWVRGQLSVHFPTAEEYVSTEEEKGETITLKQASEYELRNKEDFSNLIEICSGRKNASPSELMEATTRLFRFILWWRQGERITGAFLEYSIEERMHDIEQKLEATNEVVRQFVKWFRGGTSRDEALP